MHGGGGRENPPGGANSLDFAEPWSEGPGGSSFKSFKVQYLAHFKGNIWERLLELFEFTVKSGKLFLPKMENQKLIFLSYLQRPDRAPIQ